MKKLILILVVLTGFIFTSCEEVDRNGKRLERTKPVADYTEPIYIFLTYFGFIEDIKSRNTVII
jgi:predicted small secreted protein